MSLKLKVCNIGIEDMEYISIFNLKMPSGMHVIVKDVLVIIIRIIFYIAPQQQLYELLALYRSTIAIKRINVLLKLA